MYLLYLIISFIIQYILLCFLFVLNKKNNLNLFKISIIMILLIF